MIFGDTVIEQDFTSDRKNSRAMNALHVGRRRFSTML
jgi:hypothetical protein